MNKGYIIAVHKDTLTEITNGYTLWYNGKTKDIAKGDLAIILMKTPDCLENAKFDYDDIIGTNGSLDRYAVIYRGNVVKPAMVVLKKYGLTRRDSSTKKTAYLISDGIGNTIVCSENKALEFAETMGIANGKIVTKGNTKFISSISGEYPYEEMLEDTFNIDHTIEDNVTPNDMESLKLIHNHEAEEKVKRQKLEQNLGNKTIECFKELADLLNTDACLDINTQLTDKFNKGVIKTLKAYKLPHTIEMARINPLFDSHQSVKSVVQTLKSKGTTLDVNYTCACGKVAKDTYITSYFATVYNSQGDVVTIIGNPPIIMHMKETNGTNQLIEDYEQQLITEMTNRGESLAKELLDLEKVDDAVDYNSSIQQAKSIADVVKAFRKSK